MCETMALKIEIVSAWYEGINMSTLFWNPRRVRNFLVKLNIKPTTFSENMKQLSKHVGITVEELTNTNPILVGEKLFFPLVAIEHLLGRSEFDRLSGYPTWLPFVPIDSGPSVLEQRVRQLEINSSVLYGRIDELEKHTAAVALLYMRQS